MNLLIASFRDEASEAELKAIKRAVFQREKMMSTGIGNGLAIPHGKSKEIKTNHAAFAALGSPVGFNAIDEKPVSIVFLFAGPDSRPRSHAKILGSIAHLLNDSVFQKEVMNCQTPAELFLLIKERAQINPLH